MGVKSIFATIIGSLQIAIGISAIIFAYILHYNPSYFEVRALLGLREEYIAFFLLILGVIGFFSIVSGILVIYEWSLTRTVSHE